MESKQRSRSSRPSSSPRALRVLTKPLMTVRGVRMLWKDTSRKSFLAVSTSALACAARESDTAMAAWAATSPATTSSTSSKLPRPGALATASSPTTSSPTNMGTASRAATGGCSTGMPTPSGWPRMSSSRTARCVTTGPASKPTIRGRRLGKRRRGAL